MTLRNLRMLADIAGRDKVVLSGVETVSFHILVLLAHFRPGKFKRTFIDALRLISEPDPASTSPEEARRWFSESAIAYPYDTRLISQIRDLVEHEADGLTISATLRRLIQVPVTHGAKYEDAAGRDGTARLQAMESALHEWPITVRFERQPMPLGTAGGILWTLGEALESVDGVVANLDHLATGSVWASIRLYASSIWRLDDVVEILERTFDKVTQRLDAATSAEGVSSARASVSATGHSDLTSEHDVISRELELEKKRVELAILRLQHLEKVSDLLADRLLQVDSVEFHLKDYPIFVVQERRVIRRESMKRLRDQEIESPGSPGQGDADVQV